MTTDGTVLVERFPGIEDYCRMRVEARMSAKTADAAWVRVVGIITIP